MRAGLDAGGGGGLALQSVAGGGRPRARIRHADRDFAVPAGTPNDHGKPGFCAAAEAREWAPGRRLLGSPSAGGWVEGREPPQQRQDPRRPGARPDSVLTRNRKTADLADATAARALECGFWDATAGGQRPGSAERGLARNPERADNKRGAGQSARHHSQRPVPRPAALRARRIPDRRQRSGVGEVCLGVRSAPNQHKQSRFEKNTDP